MGTEVGVPHHFYVWQNSLLWIFRNHAQIWNHSQPVQKTGGRWCVDSWSKGLAIFLTHATVFSCFWFGERKIGHITCFMLCPWYKKVGLLSYCQHGLCTETQLVSNLSFCSDQCGLVGHRPAKQKVASSVLSQGTCLGVGLVPNWGNYGWCFSLTSRLSSSLSPSLLSLKINK